MSSRNQHDRSLERSVRKQNRRRTQRLADCHGGFVILGVNRSVAIVVRVFEEPILALYQLPDFSIANPRSKENDSNLRIFIRLEIIPNDIRLIQPLVYFARQTGNL